MPSNKEVRIVGDVGRGHGVGLSFKSRQWAGKRVEDRDGNKILMERVWSQKESGN